MFCFLFGWLFWVFFPIKEISRLRCRSENEGSRARPQHLQPGAGGAAAPPGQSPPRRAERAPQPRSALPLCRGGCGEEAAAASLPESLRAEFPGVCTVSNKKRNARSKLIFHPRKEMLLPVLCKAGANNTDTGVYCPFSQSRGGEGRLRK